MSPGAGADAVLVVGESYKNIRRGLELKSFRVYTALAEEPSSICNTHLRWLKPHVTQAPDDLTHSGHCSHLFSRVYAHTHTHTDTHTQTKNKCLQMLECRAFKNGNGDIQYTRRS